MLEKLTSESLMTISAYPSEPIKSPMRAEKANKNKAWNIPLLYSSLTTFGMHKSRIAKYDV